jgi:hypothetical protein
MKIVTKYAMLALITTSFVALNNCGNQSNGQDELSVNQEENGPASDFAILGGPPIGYPPPIVGVPPFPVEINCNDGADNNGNGLVDCMDPDCHVHPECAEWGPPLEELINERSLTVYPNGIIVPEDVVFLKARGADDDDAHGWRRNQFFASHQKDCWIDPKYMDPYYHIPLGEPLVTGPDGPIGPQLFPSPAYPYYGPLAPLAPPLAAGPGTPPIAPPPFFPAPFAFFGPKAGLINECERGTGLMDHHMDDDNNAGAGAAGDRDDDDGGIRDDN